MNLFKENINLFINTYVIKKMMFMLSTAMNV